MHVDYSFAKYNQQGNKISYSTEEYSRLLEGKPLDFDLYRDIPDTQYLADPEWTREETDYLFKTVYEYDSRWYIIHDRYDFPNEVPRTIEVCHFLSWGMIRPLSHQQDLKDRYYSVCRKLVRDRPSEEGDEARKAHLLSSLEFDKSAHRSGILRFLVLTCVQIER